MSVPTPREPHEGGRWGTIQYALDTNPRTFRLCLILLVTALGPCLAAIIAALMRHSLYAAPGTPPGAGSRRRYSSSYATGT